MSAINGPKLEEQPIPISEPSHQHTAAGKAEHHHGEGQ
jgi:hypothetical protein